MDHRRQRPVFYEKASEVVDFNMDHSHNIDVWFVKVMADSGQGTFKISLAIILDKYLFVIDRPCTNGEPLDKKSDHQM